MNIAKKTKASPNCTYGEPPVTAKKKILRNAIAPITAHTAVTTLEVRLANMRGPLSSGGLLGNRTRRVQHTLRGAGERIPVPAFHPYSPSMRAGLSLERRAPPCWWILV